MHIRHLPFHWSTVCSLSSIEWSYWAGGGWNNNIISLIFLTNLSRIEVALHRLPHRRTIRLRMDAVGLHQPIFFAPDRRLAFYWADLSLDWLKRKWKRYWSSLVKNLLQSTVQHQLWESVMLMWCLPMAHIIKSCWYHSVGHFQWPVGTERRERGARMNGPRIWAGSEHNCAQSAGGVGETHG